MDVDIIQLEPMIAASFYAFGLEPEVEAMDKLMDWADSKHIMIDVEKHPVWGFNNPPPFEAQQPYGYECWLQVKPETRPEGDMRIILFMGGTYAMYRCEGIEHIREDWIALFDWCKKNNYILGTHQGLEQIIGRNNLDSIEVNLYCPVVVTE